VSSSCLDLTRNNCYLVHYRFPAGALAGGGVGGTPRGEVLDDRLVVSALRLPGASYHRPIPKTTNLREKTISLLVKMSKSINYFRPRVGFGPELTRLVRLMVVVSGYWRVGVSTADHVQGLIILVIGTRRLIVLVLDRLTAAVTLRRQHCLPENTITLYTSVD
jgi:hypothetical protein